MTLSTDDYESETPSAGLVQWMAPGETRYGPAGLATAFGLGLVVGLGALAALQWLAPRREGLPPWRWRRGAVH
jgi:hypothetical protein